MRDSDRIFDELKQMTPHYAAEAYQFVLDSLAFTARKIGKRRHVTGAELAHGVRELALDLWGPMARHVLHSWGVTTTDDIGQIVFHLIQAGVLTKSETDRIEDFLHVYEFTEAFETSYIPEIDERGHVRRKLGGPAQPLSGLPFLGEDGSN